VVYHAEARTLVGATLAGSCTVPASSPCDITGLASGQVQRAGVAVDSGDSENLSVYVSAPENPVVAGLWRHRGARDRDRRWAARDVHRVQSVQCGVSRGGHSCCRRLGAGSCTVPASSPCDITGLNAGSYNVAVYAADSGDPTQVSTSVSATENPVRPGSGCLPRCTRRDPRWDTHHIHRVGADRVTYHAEARSHVGLTSAGLCTPTTTSPCDITGLAAGQYDVRVWAVDTGFPSNVSTFVNAPQTRSRGRDAPTWYTPTRSSWRAGELDGVGQTNVSYHAEATPAAGGAVAGFVYGAGDQPVRHHRLDAGDYNIAVYGVDSSNAGNVSSSISAVENRSPWRRCRRPRSARRRFWVGYGRPGRSAARPVSRTRWTRRRTPADRSPAPARSRGQPVFHHRAAAGPVRRDGVGPSTTSIGANQSAHVPATGSR